MTIDNNRYNKIRGVIWPRVDMMRNMTINNYRYDEI